jgi:hypothetical protein
MHAQSGMYESRGAALDNAPLALLERLLDSPQGVDLAWLVEEIENRRERGSSITG